MGVVALYDQVKSAVANVSGLRIADNPLALVNVPAAVVLPPEFNPSAMGGKRTYLFRVLVFVGTADNRGGFDQLLGYADVSGSSSLDAAIDAATIGESASVTAFRPLGVEEVNAYGYFGAEFTVEVFD